MYVCRSVAACGFACSWLIRHRVSWTGRLCLLVPVVPSADADRDGRLSIHDFIPLYKAIAVVRRAFRRQDHHSNGQIDRWAGVAWLACTHVLNAC